MPRSCTYCSHGKGKKKQYGLQSGRIVSLFYEQSTKISPTKISPRQLIISTAQRFDVFLSLCGNALESLPVVLEQDLTGADDLPFHIHLLQEHKYIHQDSSACHRYNKQRQDKDNIDKRHPKQDSMFDHLDTHSRQGSILPTIEKDVPCISRGFNPMFLILICNAIRNMYPFVTSFRLFRIRLFRIRLFKILCNGQAQYYNSILHLPMLREINTGGFRYKPKRVQKFLERFQMISPFLEPKNLTLKSLYTL